MGKCGQSQINNLANFLFDIRLAYPGSLPCPVSVRASASPKNRLEKKVIGFHITITGKGDLPVVTPLNNML